MVLTGKGRTAKGQLRARPSLVLLLSFMVLLGLINSLVINQRVVLNLFFVPVIFGAWALPKRHAVEVSILAALMVVAYAVCMPEGRLLGPSSELLVWADLGIWGGILIITAYTISVLRQRGAQALVEVKQAYAGVLSILTKFMQTVDVDTEAHGVRVSAWAVRIAEELRLSRTEVEETRVAALLHDLGKVSVSVDILRKASSLSQAGREAIKQHPADGAAMVKPVGGMLSEIADAIESHHEKYDGSGYNGVVGEQIPRIGRIVAVADAFDSLLSDRPYRKGINVYEAISVVQDAAGSHFDPEVVRALNRIVAREGEAAVGLAVDTEVNICG